MGTWDVTDQARMGSLRTLLGGLLIIAGLGPAIRGTLTGPGGTSDTAVRAALLLIPMPLIGAFLLWRRQQVG